MREAAVTAAASAVLVGVLAAGIAPAGCGDDSAGTEAGAPRVTHAGGATGCPLVDGCPGPAEKRSLVSFEAIPPAGGTAVRQYFPDIAFPAGATLNLTLRPAAKLCGAIIKDFSRIPGTVFARPDPAPIAGESLSYQDSVTTGGTFCVDLPTGSYVLRSVPDSADLPPLTTTVTVDTLSKDVDVNYPPHEAMLHVSGFVRMGFLGIDNVLVKAYDRVTGIESNSAITATPSDGDPGGAFDLVIPALTGTYTLLLSATPENPDWPTVEYPDLITPETTSGMEYGFGVVPPAISLSGAVRNMPASETGAQVGFKATIGNGVFTKTVQTSPGGGFETVLREGTYAVTVFPPAGDSSAGITSFEDVIVAAGGPALDLSLSPKKRVRGAVHYPDGVAGTGVTISAMRIGSCTTGQADPGMTPVETVAGADGSYELALDSGSWDVTFVPPQGVYNARAVKRGLCAEKAGALNVVLPRSVVVTGTMFDAFWIPAAGITFNVYMNHADESGRALLIATGLTGASGALVVTLPDLTGP
ncbi:MAG: hypothetical protein HY897_07525 [Deltaproteobacteria bacterium]|nr:hypothetical protein [Deltaproteobacteria bacterium]